MDPIWAYFVFRLELDLMPQDVSLVAVSTKISLRMSSIYKSNMIYDRYWWRVQGWKLLQLALAMWGRRWTRLRGEEGERKKKNRHWVPYCYLMIWLGVDCQSKADLAESGGYLLHNPTALNILMLIECQHTPKSISSRKSIEASRETIRRIAKVRHWVYHRLC